MDTQGILDSFTDVNDDMDLWSNYNIVLNDEHLHQSRDTVKEELNGKCTLVFLK